MACPEITVGVDAAAWGPLGADKGFEARRISLNLAVSKAALCLGGVAHLPMR